MNKKTILFLFELIAIAIAVYIGTFFGMFGYDHLYPSRTNETQSIVQSIEEVTELTVLENSSEITTESVVTSPIPYDYYSTASKSLWSWETPTSDDFIDPKIERIGNCTRVYQHISSIHLSDTEYLETIRSFVTHMNDLGIEVYATNGEPQWAIDRQDALVFIDKIGSLKESGLNFAGIVFDNEVYLLDDYKEQSAEYNETFIENNYKYYLRSKEYGLKYVPTLASYQLDKYPEFVSIYENSDMVSVMNYIADEELCLDMIKTEVEYSKETGKPIECIFHIDSSERYDAESDYRTLEDVINAFHLVADYYKTDTLSFSVHHAGAFIIE